MNYIAELFNCNEDLFYTIYDYLRFTKPKKWDFIQTTDDFSFVDIPEMKDLANDACNWLETFLSDINGYDVDSISKNTLYYMTLSYMNSHKEYWGKATYHRMNENERKETSVKTIEWLRDCINKIG
jgi:hypothetical protein